MTVTDDGTAPQSVGGTVISKEQQEVFQQAMTITTNDLNTNDLIYKTDDNMVFGGPNPSPDEYLESMGAKKVFPDIYIQYVTGETPRIWHKCNDAFEVPAAPPGPFGITNPTSVAVGVFQPDKYDPKKGYSGFCCGKCKVHVSDAFMKKLYVMNSLKGLKSDE